MSTSKRRREAPASKSPADDGFEETVLPDGSDVLSKMLADGSGVLLRQMPAERLAARSSERLTDDEREQAKLATILAERLADRLMDDDPLPEGVIKIPSEDERQEELSDFARELLAREARGTVIDDAERVRILEESRSRCRDERRLKKRLILKGQVLGLWRQLAPSFRRELLDMACVRRTLFGDGLRRHHCRPYPDARRLLTDLVLFCGAQLRRRGWDPRKAATDVGQRHVAYVVSAFYPALYWEMSEPTRIERIRVAIVSAATSAKRKPWKEIQAAWEGIEAGGNRWRSDYDEYVKDSPKRT